MGAYYTFTAQITAFDSANNVLGDYTANGISNTANNDSALFMGVRDSQARIKRIQINITNIQISGSVQPLRPNLLLVNRVTIQRTNDVVDGSWMNTARSRHTATLLPNGKLLITGGARDNRAELFDPATGTWLNTGSLTKTRSRHTATLLPYGKLLVTGGTNNIDGSLATTELYDPVSGTWNTTGPLATPRDSHTATLLPNGKLLVAGGYNDYDGSYLASAELYDPGTGTWTATGSLASARRDHTAALLPNGKVLVAGGYNGSGNNRLSSAELYDPATGTWTSAGMLSSARSNHTTTLLPNGRVLVAGGTGSGGNSLSSAEVYDPATSIWTATGSLTAARFGHTATLLPSGKLLVEGGHNGSANFIGAGDIGFLSSAEIYDPATGNWGSYTGWLATARYQHTATLLPNGKLLIAGGAGINSAKTGSASLASVELYEPAIGNWTVTGAFATTRTNHTATLLPNGKILVAGGVGGSGYLASAELYDPTTGTWAATGSLATARRYHTATLLPNGKVLVAGGVNSSGFPTSAELYDPATGTWTGTGSLAAGRNLPAAVLLPNGKLLITGGYNSSYLATAELYDPANGTWTATGSLAFARIYHTMTQLPNGKTLVTGGLNSSGLATTAELYDPATGIWSATSSPTTARYQHTATLLPNGKVLVAGGYNGSYLASAELYDPAIGTWNATGSLATARYQHAATLLPNGKVFVAGGYSGGVAITSTELFDSATGIWTTTGPLAAARQNHTVTQLPNGKVLVAGGYGSSGTPLASAELYDVGLGYSGASRPVIGSASFNASGGLVLTGTGFLGISSASGGNGSQDSPSNYPVVQLRRLDNEQCSFLPYDPSVNVSATSLRSLPVPPFSGYALATVFTNGIPSASALVSYVLPIPDIALEAPTGTPVTNGSGTLAYGSIAPSQTKDLAVTVRNTGSGDLTTITATITGTDAGQFSLISSPPASLAGGLSAPFTIRFSPTSPGSKTATLSLTSNDPDENPFTLSLTGTGTSTGGSDTTRPAISNFSFTPNSVNATVDAQTITATVRLTDDLAGVSDASAYFYSPSQNQYGSVYWNSGSRISGTALDGTYRSTFTIPRYAEGGDWKLYRMIVSDVIGNRQDYYLASLNPQGTDLVFPAGTPETLSVIGSTPDTTRPALSNFSFTPNSVDATTSAQTITATVRLTDDLAGVSDASAYFYSPSQNQYGSVYWNSGSRISGTALDGTYRSTFTIPRYAEGGDWKLYRMIVSDAIGNRRDYYPASLNPQGTDLVFPAGTPETLSVNSTVSPLVVLSSSSNVTTTGATISGTVNPRGDATSYRFEYGTSTNYGQQTTAASASNGSSNVTVSAALAGLNPNQTYYFRLTASNSFGSAYTNAGTFTTGPKLVVTIIPDAPYETSYVAGTVFGFSTTSPGSSDELTIYLRNAGGTLLTGVTASIIGVDANQYSLPSLPATQISPGSSGTSFVVRFAPTSVGVKSVQLNVTSNDPNANPIIFFVQALADTKPTFAGYSASTPADTPITLSFAKLRAKAYDADGDAITFENISSTSPEGATITQNTNGILYSPKPGFVGTDTFEIYVQDTYGVYARIRGNVTINVTAASGSGGTVINPPVLTMNPNGTVGISFQGIPGRTYLVQRTTNMANWSTLATLAADASGNISYTDPSPPPGSAFYRLAKP